jgi:hypothetical protein
MQLPFHDFGQWHVGFMDIAYFLGVAINMGGLREI